MYKMEIIGDTLEEFAQNCFNLAGNLSGAPAPVAATPAHVNPTPPVAAQPPVAAAPVNPTPPVTAQPPVAAAPVNPTPPVTAQPPVAAAPTYTHEQVGTAGAALVAANPAAMPTLMGLLQRYGVQLVTDLKPEQLGPFATELRGLGAQI